MEAQQQFIASNAIKAKRRRFSSPQTAASSSGESIMAESICSPASSSEEEDMAYCLILLAQGDGKPPPHDHDVNKINDAGFFVYDCKTCNRSFPSFQALGGHRASHKKPKSAISDQLTFTVTAEPPSIEDPKQNLALPRIYSVEVGTNNKSKIHECSICGSEFSSGQALGGHMRRHRAINNQAVASAAIEHQVKPINMLALDLNLPAPEDDHRQFPSTQQALAFSTTTLVDCYY